MVRLRVWAAIAATALGLYFVGRWQGAASVADAAAVRDAQSALAVGKPYRARLDSLRQVEHQQVSSAQAWKHRAASLRALATRTDTVRLGNQPDSAVIDLWRATANADQEAGKRCQTAFLTCQERAQTAEARAQALDSLLGGVLKVKDCHVLWLRCPSRAITGLVSYGLGALTVLVVRP